MGCQFMWLYRQVLEGHYKYASGVQSCCLSCVARGSNSHCSMKQMLRLAGACRLKYSAAMLVVTPICCALQRSGGHVCSTRRGSCPTRTMRSR